MTHAMTDSMTHGTFDMTQGTCETSWSINQQAKLRAEKEATQGKNKPYTKSKDAYDVMMTSQVNHVICSLETIETFSSFHFVY